MEKLKNLPVNPCSSKSQCHLPKHIVHLASTLYSCVHNAGKIKMAFKRLKDTLDNEQLIRLVRECPAIFDTKDLTKDLTYKDQGKCDRAWLEVASTIHNSPLQPLSKAHPCIYLYLPSTTHLCTPIFIWSQLTSGPLHPPIICNSSLHPLSATLLCIPNLSATHLCIPIRNSLLHFPSSRSSPLLSLIAAHLCILLKFNLLVRLTLPSSDNVAV